MWSLGKFKPSFWDRDIVSREFTNFVQSRVTGTMTLADRVWGGSYGERLMEVRTPIWNAGYVGDVQEWHADGAPSGGSDFYLIVWAPNDPTEIVKRKRTPSGRWSAFPEPDPTIYQAAPYEVVALRNTRFLHRIPELTERQANRRWFARGHAFIDGHVQDVPGVYAYEFA